MKPILLLTLIAVVACGGRQEPNQSPALTSVQRTSLQENSASIRAWAQVCEGLPSKANCSVEDGVLFGGILCLEGESWACEGVKASQGVDGRWWRHPTAVGMEAPDSFSRDMSLGVLSYLVVTKDRAAALQWLSWINSNGNRLCKISSDSRCNLTPNILGLMYHVWKYIGLTPTLEMRGAAILADTFLPAEANFATLGFPRHLVAVNLLIRKATGNWSVNTQKAANTLAKYDVENPLFLYLSVGATPEVSALVLKHAPTQKTNATKMSFEVPASEEPWLDSFGWEYVALIDTLLKPN